MPMLLPALLIAAAVLAAGVLIGLLARASRRTPDESLALLQNQVESLRQVVTESATALSDRVALTLTETNRTVGDRLDATTKVIGDVRHQLGKLEQSSREMLDLGHDIARLEDILQPPKLRGALGELFLHELLAQILPSNHYKLQYTFKGGQIVDAVVILRSGMVPIDAKFPLESFRRILAAEDEDARKQAKRSFLRDIKGHIDAIASKYIRLDENTFDFALMYVPAENVYYETIIKDDAFGGDAALFAYALKKRVIPVSPNSFYAYLQTIILGLRGMRVEERSREIIDTLGRLQKEFDLFADAFRLVGQHLDNSVKKFGEAQKRFGKVESKVEQIDGLAQGLQAEDRPPAARLSNGTQRHDPR
jgi:DNA recombination protein RmuC